MHKEEVKAMHWNFWFKPTILVLIPSSQSTNIAGAMLDL
jgi:hypothetical protein